MRQCVELGLHRRPTDKLTPIEEQIRRNVFWDCYIHDRYSSGIMGRPYAIAEQDIEVDPPIAANEADIVRSAAVSLADVCLDDVVSPNEGSIALFVINLRRVTARIQVQFFGSKAHYMSSSRTIQDAAKLQNIFDTYWQQLDHIRVLAPTFENIESLYQRPEWYDFLVEKDRLTLIRGMLSQQSPAGLSTSRTLLLKCLNCASEVINLYTGMYNRGQITWTRSYFQIMFTTGLSLMYSLSSLRSSSTNIDTLAKAVVSLKSCNQVLHMLVTEMRDVERFAVVFDTLSRQYFQSNHASSAFSDDVLNSSANVDSSRVVQFDHVAGELLDDPRRQAVTQNAVPVESGPLLPTEEVAFDQSVHRHTGHVLHDPMQMQSNSNADNNLPFDVDLTAMQAWPYSFYDDNVFGQMEAGLGEYAWGNLPNDGSWMQYFPTFDQ